jgi:hypothetical protein
VLVGQELDDGADGVAFSQLLPVVVVVLDKDTQDLEGLEPNPPAGTLEHAHDGGDDALSAHEVPLGSAPLARVRDEGDESAQCSVVIFRLLLERIASFLELLLLIPSSPFIDDVHCRKKTFVP